MPDLRSIGAAAAATAFLGLASLPAVAQNIPNSGSSATPGMPGGKVGSRGKSPNFFLFGIGGFSISDQSTAGDRALPGGTTTIAMAHAQYNVPAYFSGVGVLYERDQLGRSQTGTHVALKVELSLDEIYVEAAYGIVQQDYTGRSVARREGRETLLGFGRRVPILWGWAHFDVSIKRREATYDTQDEKAMSTPITRVELLPILGLGSSL